MRERSRVRRPGGLGRLRLRTRLTMVYGVLFAAAGTALVLGMYTYVQVVPHYGQAVEPEYALQASTPIPRETLDPASTPLAGPEDAGADDTNDGVVSGDGTDLTGNCPPDASNCVETIDLRSQGVSVEWEYADDPVTLSATFLTLASVTGLCLLVLSTWASWYFTGRVLRPVDDVREAARRASRGDFSAEPLAHVSRRRGDEAALLADTFQDLLHRLDRFVRDQRQTAAYASHELRGPLTSTRMMLTAARAEQLSPGETAQLVAALRQQNERTISVVEAILELAELSLAEVPHRDVRLDELVRVTLADLAPRIEAKRLCIDVRLCDGMVTGDELLLEQALRNLLENAVEHNHDSGSISVSSRSVVRPDGEALELTIENSGRIVSDEDLHQLTRAGFRNAAADADSHGFGLALVSSILEAHGADIVFEARAGGGLVARVCFARRPDPAS